MTYFTLASVKVLVTSRGIVERDNLDVHSVGNLDLVVENGLHKPPMVLHDWALASGHGMRKRPTKSHADGQVTSLGVGIDATRVRGDVEARDADLSSFTNDAHAIVQNLCWDLARRGRTAATSFETDAVNSAVNSAVGLGAEDSLDVVSERALLA